MADNPYAQWAPRAAGGPAGPITIGTPDQKQPLEVRRLEQQIDENDRRTPLAIENQTLQNQKLRQDLAKGPEQSATQIELAAKAEAAAKRKATVDALMGEVETLYNQDIKGQPITRGFGLTEYIDALPANERFSAAGNTMLPLIRPLIAQTAKEGDSNTEMLVFQSYIPSANDSDVTIEQKMKMMRILLDGMVGGQSPSATLNSLNRQDDASLTPPGAAALPSDTLPPGGGDGPTGSRPVSEIPVNPSTPPVGFEQGYEDDPQLAGVKAEYQKRLGRGDRGADILAWLRSVGVSNPGVTRTVMEQVNFRRQNPRVPIGNYNVEAIDDRAIPQSVMRELTNAAADTPVGTAILNAGNTVSGNNLDSFTANPELTRLGIDALNARNPGSAFTGQILGGAGLALTGEAALARAGVQNFLARTLAADIGTGAFQGFGANDENRLVGAATGAAAGAAGNRLGAGAQKALGATIGGVAAPAVRAIREQGIPLTLGQTVGQSGAAGRIVKGVEDRLSGAPVIGDLINARRTEGVRAFNSKAFDRALKPIDGSVGDAVGEQAVLAAQQQVTDAFTNALNGKSVAIDAAFVPDMAPVLEKVRAIPRVGEEINNSLDEVTRAYFDANGRLSGENMQALLGDLRAIKTAYRGDPLSHRINQAISQIESGFENLFNRQAPEVMPAYGKAKHAYRQLSVIEDSVLRAKNAEGVFTPAQLGLSDRANSVRFDGKRGAAAGKSPFQDFQRDAQTVLPNAIPDTGTAGRIATLLAPGAIAGSGAGAGYAAEGNAEGAAGGAGAGLSLAALLALAYTRPGQAILRGAVAPRGNAARAVGKAIEDRNRFSGRLGASGINALATQQ